MANRFGAPGGAMIVGSGAEAGPQIIKEMKRRAQIGGSVDRIAQYRYNPFNQNTNLDIPQDYNTRNLYKRFFFKTNPIVGAAIELHCIPAGEPVITRNGTKSIEAIDLTDEVLSRAGTWQKVLATDNHKFTGEMFTIQVNGLPPFRCTDEHPVLVREGKFVKTRKDSQRREPFGEAIWKPTAELKVGDYVLLPKYQPKKAETQFDLAPYIVGTSSGSYSVDGDFLVSHSARRPRFLTLTNELASLLGWYVAEGSAGREFSLNFSEQEEATEIKRLVEFCTGVSFSKTYTPKGTKGQILHFSFAPFGRWLMDVSGSGAKNKKVPQFILDCQDLDIVRAFLSAYAKGDGHETHYSRHPVTVSRTLAYQLQLLLGRLGAVTDVKIRIHPVSKNPQYYLKITQRDWVTKVLNQADPFRKKHYGLTFQDADYFYAPIRKISHQRETCQVYDIHTEDHSFGVPFLVHNSEFPLSDFHLEHEDPAVEEFLNDMLDETNFFEHMLMAAIEYWLIGEFNWFSFYNDAENPSCYTGFCLLDPNKVSIATNNFVQGHSKEIVHLNFDKPFKQIVNQGPNHAVTGELYHHLPSDMVESCMRNQPLLLSPLQCSRLRRNVYFANRGESILERVFPLLMYKDKLRSSQMVCADRYITPLELFKIGETGDPADQAEIEAFRDAVASTYYDINKLLVWHHAIQYECPGITGKTLQFWTEFDSADNEICAGLLINKGLIMGDSSTFASDVVRYDILINRYLLFRTKLEQWILKCILGPILKIHEIYVPESKVKSMAYREMCGKGRPLAYPKIRWEKQSLRDENSKLQLMTELVEKKLVPESTLIRMLNIDPKTAQEKVEDEAMAKIERHIRIIKRLQDKGITMTPEIAQILGFDPAEAGNQPAGPSMSGLPSGMDGGGSSPIPELSGNPAPGGDLGTLPEAVPGAEEGNATGGIAKPPGVQGSPSESHLPVGVPNG